MKLLDRQLACGGAGHTVPIDLFGHYHPPWLLWLDVVSETVTELAGRGIGMDVVRAEVNSWEWTPEEREGHVVITDMVDALGAVVAQEALAAKLETNFG